MLHIVLTKKPQIVFSPHIQLLSGSSLGLVIDPACHFPNAFPFDFFFSIKQESKHISK